MEKKTFVFLAMILIAFLGILAISKLDVDANLITGRFTDTTPSTQLYVLPFLFFVMFIIILLMYNCKQRIRITE